MNDNPPPPETLRPGHPRGEGRRPRRRALKIGLVLAAALAAILAALAGQGGCRPMKDPGLPWHEPLARPQSG